MAIRPIMVWSTPLAALLLSGCEQELRVHVVQEHGLIIFSAEKVASSGPVCLTDIQVTATGSGKPQTVWHISSSGRATCIDRAAYPKTPDGFTEDIAGTPLGKGKIYAVAVKAASNLSGAQLFVPGSRDGDIGADGG